jgi:hypothetical protein
MESIIERSVLEARNFWVVERVVICKIKNRSRVSIRMNHKSRLRCHHINNYSHPYRPSPSLRSSRYPTEAYTHNLLPPFTLNLPEPSLPRYSTSTPTSKHHLSTSASLLQFSTLGTSSSSRRSLSRWREMCSVRKFQACSPEKVE